MEEELTEGPQMDVEVTGDTGKVASTMNAFLGGIKEVKTPDESKAKASRMKAFGQMKDSREPLDMESYSAPKPQPQSGKGDNEQGEGEPEEQQGQEGKDGKDQKGSPKEGDSKGTPQQGMTKGSAAAISKARKSAQEQEEEKAYQEHTGKHFLFPLVMRILAVPGINLALVGPAGSGKSHAALHAGDELGIETSTQSFNCLSSKADVLGFIDANGKYHSSPFRDRFEHGGIFVADEFDACHPGIATILNAAIANGVCTFQDNQTIWAHKDFRFVCCMNTYGTGSTAEYVGRNRLDAATLDRFVFLSIPYDTSLEAYICGIAEPQEKKNIEEGGVPTPKEWLRSVRRFRRACETLKLRVIISPRASIMGYKLLPQRIGQRVLKDMLLFRGMNDIDRKKIIAEINATAGSEID